jgi:predicted enzyme related to lactoylglutathione lyase
VNANHWIKMPELCTDEKGLFSTISLRAYDFAPWRCAMAAKLSYIIEFVADMDRAINFYRDVIGLRLKFQSPQWSEFATGDITLALHPASDKNPAGKLEMGFNVPDLQQFHTEMQSKGVKFAMPPAKQDFGGMLAQFTDPEGAHVSVSGD